MTLKSALEDFHRSLDGIAGKLCKLLHMAKIRRSDGTYQHWGMERTYGSQPAQAALLEAHSEVVAEVLRAPVKELLEEAASVQVAGGEDRSAEYWSEAQKESARFLPTGSSSATRLHVRSVLAALLNLAEHRRASTRPSA